MQIPSITVDEIKRGQSGYPVWAVQRALNSVQGPAIKEDHEFDNQTELAVKRFQQYVGIIDIGIFGPKTSARMARTLEAEVPESLPDGLIHGLVTGESGDLIAAVNWSSPGGVDCGYCQRRVYTADFQNEPSIKRAFDGLYQMKLLGNSLRWGHDHYLGMIGAGTHERAWRLATLHHNYPSGADKIAQVGITGLSSYWTTKQIWVQNIGAHFDDGVAVETPLGWARYYSLASEVHNHSGVMVKYVTDWTP
jgi:hypothetical protein